MVVPKGMKVESRMGEEKRVRGKEKEKKGGPRRGKVEMRREGGEADRARNAREGKSGRERRGGSPW